MVVFWARVAFGVIVMMGLAGSAGAQTLSAQNPSVQNGLTLEEALSRAYAANPTVQAARADLRGVDEGYAQAKSGFRPTVSGSASYQSERFDGNINLTHEDPKTLALTVTEQLYSGGSTLAQMDSAKSAIMAARAHVRQVGQGVLLQAATVYLDVLRDRQVVTLNANNETVLRRQLDAARSRFALGDITQTDVRQSESRLANADAGLAAALGQMQSSAAHFESIVGEAPQTLFTPAHTPILPQTLQAALDIAALASPVLENAAFASRAAAASTRAIIGEGRPQIAVSGQVAQVYDPVQSFDDRETDTSVLISATLPFYTGGLRDSRVRQARALEGQRRHEGDAAARTVRQGVIDAWQNLMAAKAELAARQTQIDAARLARDGVKAEAQYGSRTTLDVLNAEQEYLNAQVDYASAAHDQTVAGYALLAAMGTLTPETLDLSVRSYDTARHFNAVKDKWIGTRMPDER